MCFCKRPDGRDGIRGLTFGWLLLIAALSLATGCGSDPSHLVGTWDSLSLPKGLPEIQKTQQESTAAGKSAGTADQSASEFSIRLQFYRGGRLDTVTRLPAIQSQKSGLWRLLSYDETKKLATIECELMQQRTQHEVQFLDADTIKLIPPNMAGLNVKLEFKRSR